MSAVIPDGCNDTITLDDTNESEIIECSIEEKRDKQDFFTTPRSQLKRKCREKLELNNKVISVRGFQFKNDNCQLATEGSCSNHASLECDLRDGIRKKSFPESSKTLFSTPKSTSKIGNGDINVRSSINKLLSNIQKTPDLPYLSKSKLRNVQKWLVDNDFEAVVTPPFSNLEKTPLSSQRKIRTPTTRSKSLQKKKINSSDSSSVDSEVKKVLIAVYGEDWKQEKTLKKCKTEPKRNGKKLFSTKTDVKGKAQSDKKVSSTKTVRRNILKNDASRRGVLFYEPNINLDNSLGVGNLSDSGSENGVTLKNRVFRGKKRNAPSDSSSESWVPSLSAKKKKRYVVKKLESHSSLEKRDDKRNRLENKNIKIGTPDSNIKPVKSFLASLSVSTPKRRCHPEAQDFKINFKTKKEELAQKLFKIYNTEIFDSNLPNDMNFSWNIKLRGTAGYCYNKKITKSTGQIIRFSRIEFSTKIIDRADRLRDTLIHELCHAASWVIDGVLDGHGSVWTKWSQKAMTRFPELPPIRRCHNYEIAAKYTYKCTGCGYSLNRHSKSINIERKRCGYCFGVLELFVNKKKRGKGEVPEFDSTRTLPAPNKFALFVKENYQNVKNTRNDAKHAEIMKILSQQYAMIKNNEINSEKKKK